ncbi:MAG: 3-O-methylgallate 3,4-dioxygenase [Chloroflexota bacterium]|jgi:hypothetical protein|nr:3-O-methylgallate 3,4-dioxygenase [Chloroflexota bacterium]
MAKIVLGIGTSHSPMLHLSPEEWKLREASDKRNPELWFQGKQYNFEQLHELRAGDHFEREITDEKRKARHDACQAAIAHLGETLDRVAPDVCVILGDDQHESFHDDNMPTFSVYWGQTVDDERPVEDERSRQFGLMTTPLSNAPEGRVSHPTDAVLGRHIIESMMEYGFDVSHSKQLPKGRRGDVIGHAFNFAYRRLMNNEVIPNVPIFVNTYYPPNQPTMKRCWDFGVALRQAIESMDSAARVAVIASGGLSHFVVEEDLDQHILEGLKEGTPDKLTDMPNSHFNSGTSEIRNWVILGGAIAGDGLQMSLIDYVPCYRSVAGTGFGGAFAEWQ